LLQIRTMTAADVPFGLHLSTQAGWNQLAADWQRHLALEPAGVFIAELDGVPVGTTATCRFGPVAWIAMVLVAESVRGQGVGKALMTHAIAYLDGHGAASIRLDATPLGQPLYEKLGFTAEFALTRYAGTLQAVADYPYHEKASPVATAAPAQYAALCAWDRAVTATDRRGLLLQLFAEQPAVVRLVGSDGQVAGFMASRPGAHARQLGPCLGTTAAGAALFADAWERHAGERVFLDVPDDNRPAVTLALQMGLTAQRPLVRMGRGVRVAEDVSRLWASFGPELG